MLHKDSQDPPPIPKYSRVGKEGICATGKPVADEIPLEQIIRPIKKEEKYS